MDKRAPTKQRLHDHPSLAWAIDCPVCQESNLQKVLLGHPYAVGRMRQYQEVVAVVLEMVNTPASVSGLDKDDREAIEGALRAGGWL